MHVSDIHVAIDEGQHSELRAAFRALVNWPGEDEVRGSTPGSRKQLLRCVCEALADDVSILPGSITDLLAGEAESLASRTYSSGATVVLANWHRFASILDRQA